MKSKIIVLFIVLSGVSFLSKAERYWPTEVLDNWSLSLNNSVAYITSPEFAKHCSYSRGQINLDGTEFNKAQLAYAMAAKAKNNKLRYVVDSNHTICVISGLEEIERK